ncbi:unnamed protein product [Urochloa decumbens]|uniref:Disease resistance R13L4/SHOC-2-like LRR domain-containing protein n=1 Tax=Urochloa decumbens TaxID=240449 RepID=A0ABC8VD73_9POAL
MAEPGNGAVPLPPRETQAMDDDRPSLTAVADGTAPATIEPPLQGSLAAVVEPGEGTATPPPPPPTQVPEPAAAVASAVDPAPPTDEPARRAAPQEEPDAAAAAPLQTPVEAGGQPLTANEAAEVAALPPPLSQEIVPAPAAAPAESENQLAAAAAPPLQPPPPQEASSVHKEEKDAAPEGEGKPEEKLAAVAPAPGGEGKPEEKLAVAAPAPAMARDGRRRWRQLQAAVRLLFLPCERAARGGQSTPPPEDDKRSEAKPPASGEEEKKATPTPAVEGGTKPSAPDGKQTASGQEHEVATSPPPAHATASETSDKPATAPPPPAQKQEGGGAPEHASSVQLEKKDAAAEGEGKLARRRWRWLRAAVNLIFLRPKPKGTEDEGEAKPSAPESGNEETKPAPTPAPQGEKIRTGGVPDMAGVKEKDEGKESKGGGHDVSQAGAVAGGDAAVGPEGTPAGKTKRFQKAGRRVMRIMSWYRRHRSSSRVGGEPGAAAEERKGDGTKPAATTPDGDKSAAAADGTKPASGKEEEPKPKPPPHPKWAREEARLEQILEDAFTRLLAAEFHQLKPIRKRCLLTFSVFDLAAEVKKQAMVYWWVSEFNLRHRTDHESPNSDDAAAPETTTRRRIGSCWQQARQSKAAAPAAGAGNQSPAPPPPQGNKQPAEDGGGNNNNPGADAEGIFSEFSSHGFLEPMRNWCSRVIHGCKVNPLVHWMVKRRARDERFADLDVNGSPAKLQPDSGILCLTADNRPLLQRLRMEDESQQAGNKPKTARRTASSSVQSAAKDDKETAQDQKNIETILDHGEIAKLFKGKQVILNVNAHVYPVSKSTFLHLADCLVVLQLGRWCNLDDDTYMEVDGLESLSTIGSLKNLRYLSLRGLSRLTELPIGIRLLKKLAILDMRGCQNLVNVASNITAPLKQLTHLDLTECYMLEHIGRGIIFLSELQVFKGFVFATGTQGNRACRLLDLRRLKKLQKLTISITTDANVGKGEMAELKHLASLRKLTITWSEIPSILDGDSEKVKKRRVDLIEKWTSFELPTELLKLDLRCYPKNELKLKVHKSLKKLYLRGGDLERFSIDESNLTNSSDKTNSIKTLRLRYLKNFSMEWEEIRSSLKYIEYVEIVSKDEKLMDDASKDQKGAKDTEEEGKLVKNIETEDIKKESKLVKQKKILYSTLDENGVWVKDNKEEQYLNWTQATKEKEEKSKGPIEDPTTKASSTTTDVNKNDSSNATKEQPGGKEEQVTNEVPSQLKT